MKTTKEERARIIKVVDSSTNDNEMVSRFLMRDLVDDIERLTAENARLRAALDKARSIAFNVTVHEVTTPEQEIEANLFLIELDKLQQEYGNGTASVPGGSNGSD